MKKKPKKIKKVCREEAEWRVDKRTKEKVKVIMWLTDSRLERWFGITNLEK